MQAGASRNDSAFVQQAVDRATGTALQGNSRSAAKILSEVPAEDFSGDLASFRACMVGRFLDPPQPAAELNISEPWVASLARLYLTYWHRALTEVETRVEAENELVAGIGKLLDHPLRNASDLDSVGDEVKTQAYKRGFHALLGTTAPLRELMLWKKESVEERKVQLPEGPYSVKVSFLDDFVVRGWGYYATCGRRSAGGWATDDGLFAIVPAYKSLSDETFSVRFLAHETQHFADKHRFGNLESWELEYRAKLVELALANESQASTLTRICENRGDDKNTPHAYANSRVVHDIDLGLNLAGRSSICEGPRVPGNVVRKVARAVLMEDSKKRR